MKLKNTEGEMKDVVVEEEEDEGVADPPPGLTNFVGACWPR